MKNKLVLVILIIALVSGALVPGQASADQDARVKALMQRMSPAEKIGQLFVVTFQGNDVSQNSDVAKLIRDYHIGGVVISEENGNFRNEGDTASQVARLTNQLQTLSFSFGGKVLPDTPPWELPAGMPTTIPLLIGVEQEGDGYPFTDLRNGFTPLPSPMAVGATWKPKNASKIGEIVGKELAAVGVNMLLGPSLDVLDTPRQTLPGSMGTRTFGGDPFWVGKMGQQYISGVHKGSGGKVLTVAKHFPGQGSSDRRPEEEVATVQKSLAELKQVELAPFLAVTSKSTQADQRTDMLMSSHVRYRGFQGNIRSLTPPISMSPQLQQLLALPSLKQWRDGGGVVMSDALGVPAIRSYEDPELKHFPYRQVAQEAFLAGNDLLYLSRFALTDNWKDELANIEGAIGFFQKKYGTDPTFKAAVDRSVERILRLKLRLYPSMTWKSTQVRVEGVDKRVGKDRATIGAIAKSSITLLYPGPKELADRMPTGPQAGEKILIVTDVRKAKACPTCKEFQLIPKDALQKVFLHLYGPEGTGQIKPSQIQSISFHDLKKYVVAREEGKTPPDPAIAKALSDARWIFFAMLDVDTAEYPDSDALSRFLRLPSEERDKKLVVLSYSAPYYLDQTEISKLTAFFGVYSKVPPFLEASVRGIYHEFAPAGHSPVTITALNYNLIDVTAPDPGQVIKIIPLTKAEGEGSPQQPANIKVGSTLELATSPILDHNGNPVPDGTPVVFRLMYPAESLELPQHETTTVNGVARTTVKLEREGELYITASAGEARKSTTLVITITGGKSGIIATLVPKPTPTNTPTPTPTPTATPTPTPFPTPAGPTGEVAPPRKRRVDLISFLAALLGVVIAGGMGFDSRKQESLDKAVALLMKSVIVGMLLYVLYGLGVLPGASWMQRSAGAWGAALVAFVGGMIPILVGW